MKTEHELHKAFVKVHGEYASPYASDKSIYYNNIRLNNTIVSICKNIIELADKKLQSYLSVDILPDYWKYDYTNKYYYYDYVNTTVFKRAKATSLHIKPTDIKYMMTNYKYKWSNIVKTNSRDTTRICFNCKPTKLINVHILCIGLDYPQYADFYLDKDKWVYDGSSMYVYTLQYPYASPDFIAKCNFDSSNIYKYQNAASSFNNAICNDNIITLYSTKPFSADVQIQFFEKEDI